jgi:hypothetical protein
MKYGHCISFVFWLHTFEIDETLRHIHSRGVVDIITCVGAMKSILSRSILLAYFAIFAIADDNNHEVNNCVTINNSHSK